MQPAGDDQPQDGAVLVGLELWMRLASGTMGGDDRRHPSSRVIDMQLGIDRS